MSGTCAAAWRLALLALLFTLLVGEVRLPLPHVPVKTLGQALEPVAHRVSDADGGEWVAGGGDGDARDAMWHIEPTACLPSLARTFPRAVPPSPARSYFGPGSPARLGPRGAVVYPRTDPWTCSAHPSARGDPRQVGRVRDRAARYSQRGTGSPPGTGHKATRSHLCDRLPDKHGPPDVTRWDKDPSGLLVTSCA